MDFIAGFSLYIGEEQHEMLKSIVYQVLGFPGNEGLFCFCPEDSK
jgi:hypothetical protein